MLLNHFRYLLIFGSRLQTILHHFGELHHLVDLSGFPYKIASERRIKLATPTTRIAQGIPIIPERPRSHAVGCERFDIFSWFFLVLDVRFRRSPRPFVSTAKSSDSQKMAKVVRLVTLRSFNLTTFERYGWGVGSPFFWRSGVAELPVSLRTD